MIEVFDLGSMEDKGFVEQKRRLKTPSQVEALENIYAEHKYPTESMKAKLSRELGLSEKQVQRWFRHRRLKDKKGKKEEPDSNEELDAGSGSNLQQQQHLVRTEMGRSEKKRLLGISDYPSAVLAAELNDHDMLKRNQRVMEEDPHHAGTVSTSQDTSSLQSKSSYEMDALRNGNYVEMKGSNSKKSKGQVMHMGMEHTYPPQHFAVATEDQYVAKGLKQAGGSNSKQAKNWNRFKAKDSENHRFVNNHDYPSAVLAAELTDRELLKGNHDIVEDPYVSLSQERSSLQSGSSYEMEARRLPSKSLNSFEIEARSKRREKEGLHMVVEPIYWQQAVEHQAISAVKAQLGRLFREDGPILGVEFDPLPPDAFGYR